MEIVSDSFQECRIYAFLGLRSLELLVGFLQRLEHPIIVLLNIQVGDLSSVKYIVDIFKEGFIHDLCVSHQESTEHVVTAAVKHSEFEVFPEMNRLVVLG
jgi:hypothetical protein